MSTRTVQDLETLSADLSLGRSAIGASTLTGYLPDGAAVECSLTEAALQLSRRVATASARAARPTVALERFIEWLNRRDETRGRCWSLRRHQKPAAVEVWLTAETARAACGPDARIARGLSRELAGAARRESPTIQALCQPRVAETLCEYLTA